MFIASKYEDIQPPSVYDFIYVSDNAYTKEEFLEMEMSILTTLEFEVGNPTSYRFLERFSQIAGID